MEYVYGGFKKLVNIEFHNYTTNFDQNQHSTIYLIGF